MKAAIILGFTESKQTSPGVWAKSITELPRRADVLTYNKRYDSGSEQVNDDIQFRNRYQLTMNRRVQIVEDIKYIIVPKYGDTKWKVTAVEVLHPKMILTVGGVYNGG